MRPNVALEQRDRRALAATSAPRPCHSRRLARELDRSSSPVNVEHIGPSPLASPEVVAKPEPIKALNASCHRGRCPSYVVMGSHLPDRGPLWMHAIFRTASGREPDQQHTGLVDCITVQGPRRSRSLQPLGQRCASSCLRQNRRLTTLNIRAITIANVWTKDIGGFQPLSGQSPDDGVIPDHASPRN